MNIIYKPGDSFAVFIQHNPTLTTKDYNDAKAVMIIPTKPVYVPCTVRISRGSSEDIFAAHVVELGILFHKVVSHANFLPYGEYLPINSNNISIKLNK